MVLFLFCHYFIKFMTIKRRLMAIMATCELKQGYTMLQDFHVGKI